VGDFNKDGKLDVIIPGAMLLGNGDGALRASFTNVAASATVDLNGDGNLDLVVRTTPPDRATKQPAGVISIQLGKGDGTFPNRRQLPRGSDAESLAIGDLKCGWHPGRGGIEPPRRSRSPCCSAMAMGRSRPPSTMPPAIGKRSNIVALGDFNADGFMDLAVASGGQESAIRQTTRRAP